MFNTTRPIDAPKCLGSGTKYNHDEVINALKEMFYEKCYLCERGRLQDPEVEHFKSHARCGGKTDWNNLFYACSRCNSIKGDKHNNILDCTDIETNVFKKIRFTLKLGPDNDIEVSSNVLNSEITENTVKLLNECYNNVNSGLRKVSRDSLIEDIYEYALTFFKARQLLKSTTTGRSAKLESAEIIEQMLDVKHPFSAIWRWQYLSDNFLKHNHPELQSKIT